MPTTPQAEHEWLARLAGEWTGEMECQMGPDQPPLKTTGTETVQMLGGPWYIAEGKGEMPGGGEGLHRMIIGFDPSSGRFVGNFVASGMTHMWIYNGTLDASRKALTLETEGPGMSGEKLGKYRDTIEMISDDHRTLTSEALTEDGQWVQFMKADYRRVRQAGDDQ